MIRIHLFLKVKFNSATVLGVFYYLRNFNPRFDAIFSSYCMQATEKYNNINKIIKISLGGSE